MGRGNCRAPRIDVTGEWVSERPWQRSRGNWYIPDPDWDLDSWSGWITSSPNKLRLWDLIKRCLAYGKPQWGWGWAVWLVGNLGWCWCRRPTSIPRWVIASQIDDNTAGYQTSLEWGYQLPPPAGSQNRATGPGDHHPLFDENVFSLLFFSFFAFVIKNRTKWNVHRCCRHCTPVFIRGRELMLFMNIVCLLSRGLLESNSPCQLI